MSQQKLLTLVADVLDRGGIAYMVTGSIASSLQGEPRSTHDVDLVVRVKPSSVDWLIRAFPAPKFYINRDAVSAAIEQHGMFNLIELEEGDKVDFWILTDDPFDQSRFSRRQKIEIDGIKLQVSRPEDTILMKLRWAKMSGGSEKQFTDAVRVYEVQLRGLDLKYLHKWAGDLGIDALLTRLEHEAQVLP